MPVIYKADGGVDFTLLTKASDKFDENGELLAVVYAPEVMDSQGDIASAEVIKDMMHTSMRDGIQIDVRHDMKPLSKDQAFIAESFEIQKGDPRFTGFKDYNGKAVDVTGAWGTVLKIEDANLRQQYRDGKWNGVSMAGAADVETINKSDDTPLDRFLASITKRFGLDKDPTKDTDMNAEELKKALEENNKALAETIAKAIKGEPEKTPEQIEKEKADKAKADVEKGKPVFKGEPTAENLAKFRKEVSLYNITSNIDWTDPASVAKAEAAIKALEAEGKENLDDIAKAAGVTDTDSEEVRKLKIDLFKAQKKSNQPKEKDTDDSTFSKEDDECVKIGQNMAKAMNSGRGYTDKE